MADTNAKIDVTRNGRGQIISYGVENYATYSPILLSDKNRQTLKKYNKSEFVDRVDVEIKEFTEQEGLLDLNLAAEITTFGKIYINIDREVDLQYISDLSELATGNTTIGGGGGTSGTPNPGSTDDVGSGIGQIVPPTTVSTL